MSPDTAQLVRYIRDITRELTKMADAASLECLAYLLSLVVLEAETLNAEIANDGQGDGQNPRSRG